jgi:hypothetical protein
MTISQTPDLFKEILSDKPISTGILSYFRTRLRLTLHSLILDGFLQQKHLTKAGLARRIGRKPEVINRLLANPGNWTVDTISDLLLAIGAELHLTLVPLLPQHRPDVIPLHPSITWRYVLGGSQELPRLRLDAIMKDWQMRVGAEKYDPFAKPQSEMLLPHEVTA